MTQHVRRSYRSHRGSAWALVALVTVIVAAAVVPFATGAPPKYYTLDAEPDALCYSGPGQQEQFMLTLTNKTRNNALGSANITAPSYAALVEGTASLSVTGTATVNTSTNTIEVRGINLPTTDSAATITVTATVSPGSGQTWSSVAKQSNSFADAGPGNLFALQGDAPSLTVSNCTYVFTEEPETAERGAAQDVKVQLQTADGAAVAVSSSLTLTALQGGTAMSSQSDYFEGLISSAQDASETWNFSVTGKITGTGYALRAGNTTSPTFAIVDGLCNPNTTDTEHVAASCSLTSNFGTGPQAGITINNHRLDPIAINFAAGSTADGKCEPWNRALFTVDGETYTFPGVELDFTWGGGMLQVIYRLRNSDWVLTSVSRGNQDIEICAGARHGVNTQLNKPKADGGAPFVGKYGEATWDSGDGLFWGVLASVQNPAKVKPGGDPAVCARGTTDLATGPDGAMETWRTWTICIPFDWDWKNFG